MDANGWQSILLFTCGLLAAVHVVDTFLVEVPVVPAVFAALFLACAVSLRFRPRLVATILVVLCGGRALLGVAFLVAGPTEGLPWFETAFAAFIMIVAAAGALVAIAAARTEPAPGLSTPGV